jgi:hypothetical protein
VPPGQLQLPPGPEQTPPPEQLELSQQVPAGMHCAPHTDPPEGLGWVQAAVASQTSLVHGLPSLAQAAPVAAGWVQPPVALHTTPPPPPPVTPTNTPPVPPVAPLELAAIERPLETPKETPKQPKQPKQPKEAKEQKPPPPLSRIVSDHSLIPGFTER